MPNLRDITFQAKAVWKRFTSTFKSEWTIEDYPLRRQRPLAFGIFADVSAKATSVDSHNNQLARDVGRRKIRGLKHSKNSVRLLNDSRPTRESCHDLAAKVPIQFAATIRIGRHADIGQGVRPKCHSRIEWAWLSDESSLGDLHDDESNKKLIEKIRMV